jgi:O-antigen/teichoic acid export membrane protein
VVWLVVTLVPTTLIFAVQGVLQGGERFEALAVLLAVAGLTRVAGGITGTTGGLAGVFAGTAVGAALALAVSLWLVRRELRGPVNPQRIGAELLHAAAGLGALLALTNVDVILARHYLPPEVAGRYAAGAVAAKVAFWLPQAVAMVAFPRLTDPELRDALLTKAVAVVAGLGLATSAGAAVLGPWLFGHLLNPEYATLGATLGLFAAAGAAGTLVQLVLYTGIAAGERAIGLLLGGALVVLVALVGTVAHGSVLAIVGSVLGVELTLTVVGLAVVRPVRTWRPATDRA